MSKVCAESCVSPRGVHIICAESVQTNAAYVEECKDLIGCGQAGSQSGKRRGSFRMYLLSRCAWKLGKVLGLLGSFRMYSCKSDIADL